MLLDLIRAAQNKAPENPTSRPTKIFACGIYCESKKSLPVAKPSNRTAMSFALS